MLEKILKNYNKHVISCFPGSFRFLVLVKKITDKIYLLNARHFKNRTHNQGFDVFSISLESDILQAEILNFGATLKDLRFSGFENSMVLGMLRSKIIFLIRTT